MVEKRSFCYFVQPFLWLERLCILRGRNLGLGRFLTTIKDDLLSVKLGRTFRRAQGTIHLCSIYLSGIISIIFSELARGGKKNVPLSSRRGIAWATVVFFSCILPNFVSFCFGRFVSPFRVLIHADLPWIWPELQSNVTPRSELCVTVSYWHLSSNLKPK